MARPIIAQKIILLAVRTFSGSPPDIKNKKPAIIIIIGKIAVPIQRIKLMIFSIHSENVAQAKGLIRTAAKNFSISLNYKTFFVPPARFELASLGPKPSTLSIKLQGLYTKLLKICRARPVWV